MSAALQVIGIGLGLWALIKGKGTNTNTNTNTDTTTTDTTTNNGSDTGTSTPTTPTPVDPRNAPMYYGDKSAPYDPFYDLSNNPFGDESAIRAYSLNTAVVADTFRMRIDSRVFVSNVGYMDIPLTYVDNNVPPYAGIPNKILNIPALRLNAKGNVYCFAYTVQIFNPTASSFNIETLRIDKLLFNNRELVPVSKATLSKGVGLKLPVININTQIPANGSVWYEIIHRADYDFGLADKLSFMNPPVKIGQFETGFTHMPVGFTYLHQWQDVPYANGAGMFAIEGGIKIAGADFRGIKAAILEGNQPATTTEKYWENQYVGSNPRMFTPVTDDIRNLYNNAKAAIGL